MKLKALFGAGLAFARKHEGTILTALSMTTTVAAVYFAMKDSEKIAEALDKIHNDQEMSKLEKARTVLKPSARMLVATGASLGFQVANHKFAANTISSLTNAVTMYKTLNDEKDKVTEEIAGKETADEIKDAVMKKHVGQSVGEGPTIRYIHTGHGDELFHDPLTNNWFYSDRNFVKDTVVDLNFQLPYNDVCVDEYAYALGIPHNDFNEHEFWRCGDRIRITLDPMKLENDQLYYEINFKSGAEPKKKAWREYDE